MEATSAQDPGLFPGTVLAILLALGGCLLLRATRNQRGAMLWQTRIFLLAFAIRFAVSILIYQFGLVAVLGDEDASGWIAGVQYMDTWVHHGVTLVELPVELLGAFDGYHLGYKYMLGAVFFLTGCPYRLVAAALNGFFGAMTVVFAYRIARSLFSEWVAVRVGWWTCFWPSMVIWSAMTVKEPVVIFMETIALYACIRLHRTGFSPRHLLLCVSAIVVLSAFRFYAVYIVAAAVVLSFLSRGRMSLKTGLSGIVLTVMLVGMIVGSGIFARNEAMLEYYDLAQIQSYKHAISTGGAAAGAGSGVASNYELRTPGGIAMALGVGGAHLLLAPFPWQLGSASTRMALTIPEVVVWWWLFFAGVIPGTRYLLRNRLRDIGVMLVFLLGFALLYSMMFGNVGLIFRQRAQLLPWLLIFAMVGMEQRALRQLAARARWQRPAFEPAMHHPAAGPVL